MKPPAADAWWAEVVADRERSMRKIKAAQTPAISTLRKRRLALVFLLRPKYLFERTDELAVKPGRPCSRSKWEKSLRLRKDLYRRLVTLPSRRLGKGKLPTATIKQIDRDLNRERFGKRGRATEIVRRLVAMNSANVLRMLGAGKHCSGHSVPDVSTVRKVLRMAKG